jgi:hypothetical protein
MAPLGSQDASQSSLASMFVWRGLAPEFGLTLGIYELE